jgi:glycosyltransferase involved in cell wall biosynthesis
MPSLGIGIVTHNRKDILASTIEDVRRYTRQADAMLVVADDGSSDGTPGMLREKRIPVVTGVNMGISWNKNRALFMLAQQLCCETVILLEDDTHPQEAGWERHWMEAVRRWGHVNYAGDWMRPHFLSGTGTLEDPARTTVLTAQCSGFSRAALTYGGYYDTRFKGFGHEHVEHTIRLRRAGYFAGLNEPFGEGTRAVYFLIKGGVGVRPAASHYNAAQADANQKLAHELIASQDYSGPWRSDGEMRQFRSEIESALAGGTQRFLLHAEAAAPTVSPSRRSGWLGRLFGTRAG